MPAVLHAAENYQNAGEAKVPPREGKRNAVGAVYEGLCQHMLVQISVSIRP